MTTRAAGPEPSGPLRGEVEDAGGPGARGCKKKVLPAKELAEALWTDAYRQTSFRRIARTATLNLALVELVICEIVEDDRRSARRWGKAAATVVPPKEMSTIRPSSKNDRSALTISNRVVAGKAQRWGLVRMHDRIESTRRLRLRTDATEMILNRVDFGWLGIHGPAPSAGDSFRKREFASKG